MNIVFIAIKKSKTDFFLGEIQSNSKLDIDDKLRVICV